MKLKSQYSSLDSGKSRIKIGQCYVIDPLRKNVKVMLRQADGHVKTLLNGNSSYLCFGKDDNEIRIDFR